MAASATALEYVQKMYIAYFGRPVAPTGQEYYGTLVDTGNVAALQDDFWNSTESQGLFNQATTEGKVNAIFNQLFGRDAAVAGLTHWTSEINSGRVSLPAAALTILNSAADADLAAFNAKLAVAQAFTNELDTTAEILAYQSNTDGGRSTLSAVETEAQATAAVATIATTVASVVAGGNTNEGQTFTLTTGSDIITGTAGNDTVNASVVFDATELATAASTFTVADQITGGAGTDTLKLTVSGAQDAGVTIPAATITGVENIDIRNTVAQTASVNASNFAGVTAINADRSVGDVAVTAVATGASVGMIGDGTVANGTLSYAYATATADQVINIAGGTVNTATANITATASTGVTKATINSTGAANKVDTIKLDSAGGNTVTSLTVNAATNLTATLTAADFAATAALTVSGAAASVDLGTTFDGKTIDASGLTAGGLTIATNTNLTSFKGGQGNDTVSTTVLAAAAVAGAVDAGAGTADILNVATATDVDTAAEAALFTNFEVLRNSGTTDLDVSLLSGITSVQLNSANAGATKLTAAQAANIKVLASNATNTISLTTATGTADVLGLTLENETAAAVATAIDVTALTATGFETLNVVSSSGVKAGGTGVGNDLAFAAAGDLTAINVSGAYDLTIAAANITKAVNITSTQTGTAALYVSGNFANGSSVTGSGGADAFILGTGFGSYNAGAGNDTISATAAQLNTGANYNVVNGGDGTDTLNITDGATAAITLVDNNLSKISGIEKIVVTDTTTGAQSIQTGGWFDAAFKANGVNLETTSSTGAITIDMTSFTGAATLKATSVSAGAATGVINIQTGSGADKVTVASDAATITNVISTFDGNDTIVGGLGVETITGGKGADTITGGGGADKIAIGAGDSLVASMDVITDFNTAGADTLVFAVAQTVLGADATTLVAGSNVQTSAGGLVTFHANDNTLALKIAAIQADAELDVANSIAVFQDGLNTYVYSSGAAIGNADDQIIQLTGVTGAAGDVITGTGTVNITIA